MLAAQRDETELALACQSQERNAGVCGQRSLAPQMVLRRVESSGRGTELLGHDDPMPVEIDPLPTQRIQLTGTQARERGHLQPGRKRRTSQLARVGDHLPYLLLCRGLLVTPALAARDAQLLERVAVDQSPGLYRCSIVEHRTQALHRPGTPTAREPVRNDRIPNLDDRDIAVALGEALGQLPAADVARLLGTREQRIGFQRSQKLRMVTSLARTAPNRSRAFSRARFASALVANVLGPPTTFETLRFFPVARS